MQILWLTHQATTFSSGRQTVPNYVFYAIDSAFGDVGGFEDDVEVLSLRRVNVCQQIDGSAGAVPC